MTNHTSKQKIKYVSIQEPKDEFFYCFQVDANGNLVKNENSGRAEYFTISNPNYTKNSAVEDQTENSPETHNSNQSIAPNYESILSIHNMTNKYPFPQLTNYDPNGIFLHQRFYQ